MFAHPFRWIQNVLQSGSQRATALTTWRKGANGPSAGARKLVWLVWTLVFHPENLRSLFDVATWGKFDVASNGGAGVLGAGRLRSDALPSVLSSSDKKLPNGTRRLTPMASAASKNIEGQVEFAVSLSEEH